MSRPTLAQQLKQLEAEETPQSVDPESAYSNLDGLNITERKGNEGREHYVDVGPSRLRGQFGDMGDRYGGEVRGRQKIFDDDEEEEEDEDDEADEEEGDGESTEGEEDEEEDGDEDEDEAEGDDDEVDEDDEDEEEGDEEEEDLPPPPPKPTSSSRLDPVAALRDSRMKDIEKGQAIKRQKAIFDAIVTLRITFQKALTASTSLSSDLPNDAAGEVSSAKDSALQSLGDLNERLFALREGIRLPGTEQIGTKRKRVDDEVPGEEYWFDSARDSFALNDASHPNMLPILEKWSSKIQAASLQVGSKGSKFLQSTKTGQDGIMEAIQAGLAGRKENAKPLIESEETAYRSILREVIESRSGQAPSDLSHLRREKKKKREAERGGSKGRKLRYTVQEKAQNFVVPIPLRRAWHDEQVDELFGSLFGGVGMSGAKSEGGAVNGVVNAEEGLAELGGLRVF